MPQQHSDSWMLSSNDPARDEISRRAKELGIISTPDKAAHALGTVALLDGRVVNTHVIHAVDAIITDGTSVLMITRKNEPSKGMPALPGGFMDPVAGKVESLATAAMREALEETGVTVQGKGKPVGERNFDRPYDVRICRGNGLYEKYGIADGDLFMVSTQGIRFDVDNLQDIPLHAADDAEDAYTVPIEQVTEDFVGVPDHAHMVQQAMQL